MAQSILTSMVEESDKIAFENFCDSVGLTASSAINLFVKTVNRVHKIPFEISLEQPSSLVSPMDSSTDEASADHSSKDKVAAMESLMGILPCDITLEEAREERLSK